MKKKIYLVLFLASAFITLLLFNEEGSFTSLSVSDRMFFGIGGFICTGVSLVLLISDNDDIQTQP
jgi:hypothetical protein